MIIKVWSHKFERWVDVYIEDIELQLKLETAADSESKELVLV